MTPSQQIVIAGDDVEVHEDALLAPIATHPELDDATAGDLVAGVQYGGYVRRIVEIDRDGGRFVMATVDVPLSEAVPDADSKLNEGKADSSQHQVSLGFALDNRLLHQGQGITVELEHGSLRFTPLIDLDLTLRGAKLEHFLAAVGGRLDGALAIDVSAGNAGTWKVARTAWRDSVTFVQMVGWVPVVETVEVVAGVGVDVSSNGPFSVRANGSLSASMRAGVEYDSRWHGIGTASMQREASVSEVATPTSITLEPYVFAEIYVWMYGVAGPYVRARSELNYQHDVQDMTWNKSVSLVVDGGAALDIPFGSTYSYDARVLDRTWPL